MVASGDLFKTLLTILILLIGLALWYLIRHYNYWKKRGVPYPKPLWLIGNLSFLMRKSIFDFFHGLWKNYPVDYVGIFLAMKPALVVQTPELAKKILVTDNKVFQDRYIHASCDGDPYGALNLFTVKNPTWQKMRVKLMPMFSSLRLEELTKLMNINSKHLLNKIKRDLDLGNVTRLKELFTMYTSDTVAYTVFGLRASKLCDEPTPLWTITQHMMHFNFRRGFEFSMTFLVPAVADFLKLKFFSAGATQHVRKLFWDVVNERESRGITTEKDLVSHLVELKENLKLPADVNDQLADDLMLAQAAVFILGAVETSSTTLSNCLHELAHHPVEQEKLYQEINEAFTQSGKDVLDFYELLELKYLSACIYETLRKYPPLAYLERVCSKEYKLTDELTIEKGVPVLVNVISIHRNEALYPAPHTWDPARPSPVSDNDHRNYSFMPFGEGPHFCIGKRYGMMQMRAALSQIVHKFELKPGPGPYEMESDPYTLILSPKNGGLVQFVPRNTE